MASLRVAEAFQRRALLFPSPEALRKYLHDHPNADKSKHKVEKHGPGDRTEHGDEEKPGKPLSERVKGWGSKAIAVLKKSPESVQKFVKDDGFRRETLQSAHKALTEAPEKIAEKALHTAKHEVEEFSTAGKAIGKLMKGGKIDDHEKKALKTVGFHIALTAAATALTATGPLAGALTFGKSLARHVAMKAVSNALGRLHVLEEMGHVGHGIAHVMSKMAAEKGEEVDQETAMAHFFMAAVAKELKGVKDGDIQAALEEDVEK
jgi:hypothetical protein